MKMKPIKTARYYGFFNATEHIKDFAITKSDIVKAKPALIKHPNSDIAEKISILRMFHEKKMTSLPQPSMIFYKSKAKGHHSFNLDIIGNSKSIADAILIETAFVILKEEFAGEHISVELNTLGDRESMARLHRELSNFYRKHWDDLPKKLQQIYKKDPFASFGTTDTEGLALRALGPDPIRCLNEYSRQHFKEVIEYIENMDIPYSINHSLMGDCNYASETVFEIATHSKSGHKTILASGQHYGSISRRYLGKKDIPAVGVTLHLKKESLNMDGQNKEIKPKFFFIQLGFEAKLQSLQLLEKLRKAHMGVYQSLSRDKMTSQLSLAEKMEIPYIIIMGKKEAMEGNAIVRNVANRCQDTVPLSELVDYAKGLK